MSTNTAYYIPHKATWPVIGTAGLMTMLAGFANYLNGSSIGPTLMIIGLVVFIIMLVGWFTLQAHESESGMYKLILRSKMPNTKKFSDWITNEVLPSIRKYGYYKIKKTYENQKSNLLEKINDLEKRNKIMTNDMKKEKFPDGALVYIIDYSDEDTSVDGIFKLGK